MKNTTIMRKKIVLLMLLMAPVLAFGKRVASGDIIMLGYEQNVTKGMAVLTLQNNTEDVITRVRAKLTYVDMDGKNLDKEELKSEVRILPRSTGTIHVKGLARANYIYYKQLPEASEGVQGYMVAFELKDYASESANEVQSEPSDTLWNVVRITLGVLILLVMALICVGIPTRIIKRRKAKKLEMVLVLLSLSSVLLAYEPTGTLPIVYVTTASENPVTDRENYVPGSIYITNTANPSEALGSAASPVAMKIRGRGNYTWKQFEKKPYKIKLDESSKVLGLPKSKHWALLAGADDGLGFMRNATGFLLGQYIGLKWTSHQIPVELVINGEYRGLYFLTETIRIQKNRINIAEQPKGNEDPMTLRGGWLLEIDNYATAEDGCIMLEEGNGQHFGISVDTPDSLSEMQFAYISSQMRTLNSAFYEHTSSHWEQLVDLDEIVKFYLVQEIIENCESFHGSCYFYRDQGTTAKWYFGPVWDFGNAYWRHQELSIYDSPSFSQVWIGQIASFPSFQMRLQEFWYDFLNYQYEPLQDDILAFKNQISTAVVRDADRWDNHGDVCTNRNIDEKYNQFMDNLHWRVNYLRAAWGDGVQAIPDIEEDSSNRTAIKAFINGQMVIIRDGAIYSLTGTKLGN